MKKIKYKKYGSFFTVGNFKPTLKVDVYKFYLKVPELVECYECGHKHLEWTRKGFIKIGEKKFNLNKVMDSYLDDIARLGLENAATITYGKKNTRHIKN